MTVSVIIAVYNCEKYLSNLLCNVKNQTFTDFEVIFVDDSSTDDSYKILEEFCKNDERFSLYSKENTGVSSARNFGIEKAKGEYLVFWDGDDEVSPRFLQEALSSTESDKLWTCGFNYDLNGNVELKVFSERKVVSVEKNRAFQLVDKWLFNTLWNKIFLKKIIDDNSIRFEESFTMGEDTDFVLKYTKYVNGFIVCNEPLYTYYTRSTNASSRYHKTMLNATEQRNKLFVENLQSNAPFFEEGKIALGEKYQKELIGVLWHYCKFYKADKNNKKYIKSTLVELNKKGVKKVKVNAFLSLVIKLKSVALTRFYYKTVLEKRS